MFVSLIKRLAQKLNQANIPYIVIGGQAVLLYGEARFTKDIDITLGIDTDGLEKVLGLSGELGLKILVSDAQKFVKENMVLPLLEKKSGIRIDLIFSFSPFERQAIQRSKTVKFGKTVVHFASLEDLVIHKMIAGRPRDIEDVRTVLLKNPRFDESYILKWLNNFNHTLGKGSALVFKRIVKETKR